MLGAQAPAGWCLPARAVLNPIGEAAVADLAVAPRPGAHDGEEANLAAGLEEGSQVFLSLPVPLALDLFVVVPKNIARDDFYAAGFHFLQRLAPLGAGIPGKMDLAHDGEPRLAVEEQAAAVERDFIPRWILRGAELEVA